MAAELGVGCEERSILDDPELRARYWEQIPVTLVDGEPARLLAGLGGPAAGGAAPPEPGGRFAHFVLCVHKRLTWLRHGGIRSPATWESRDQP